MSLRIHGVIPTVKDWAKVVKKNRSVLWEWSRRMQEYGEEGLLGRKRGPKVPANKPPKEIERLVVWIHRKVGLSPQAI